MVFWKKFLIKLVLFGLIGLLVTLVFEDESDRILGVLMFILLSITFLPQEFLEMNAERNRPYALIALLIGVFVLLAYIFFKPTKPFYAVVIFGLANLVSYSLKIRKRLAWKRENTQNYNS